MIISDLNTLEVVEANDIVGGGLAVATVNAIAFGPSAIIATTNSNAASGGNFFSGYDTATSGTLVFGVTLGAAAIKTSSLAVA